MTMDVSAAEVRVIAALVEKSITTPQYYPMSVNALLMAANQKNQRNPVMQLTEGEVGIALRQLEERGWVRRDDMGSRVVKWRQYFQHQMLLKRETQALLVTLLLRGPQTLLELRANAAGLGGPDTAESVLAGIQDLCDRAEPLVLLLPKVAGQKEARYCHLLSGMPALDSLPHALGQSETAVRAGTERGQSLAALEARVAALEAALAKLHTRLGDE